MQVRTPNATLDSIDMQIIRLIEENPGIKYIDIHHKWFADMSEDTLRYRMESLHAAQQIIAVKQRRFIHCYPVD